MNHRIGRNLFALAVGLGVSILAYQWITDPAPRVQRQAEEQAVLAARELVKAEVGQPDLEIVDPLSPDREVGKVYVYAEDPGWAVSGYYRRGEDDRWHAYLAHLSSELAPQAFRADDDALAVR